MLTPEELSIEREEHLKRMRKKDEEHVRKYGRPAQKRIFRNFIVGKKLAKSKKDDYLPPKSLTDPSWSHR